MIKYTQEAPQQIIKKKKKKKENPTKKKNFLMQTNKHFSSFLFFHLEWKAAGDA